MHYVIFCVCVEGCICSYLSLYVSSSQSPRPLSGGERAAGVLRGGNQSQSSAADCHDFSLNFHLLSLINTGSSFLPSVYYFLTFVVILFQF